MTDIERLQEHGFKQVGLWRMKEGQPHTLELNETCRELTNVIYAFTRGEQLEYIGKTNATLAKRMSQYETPGKDQSTNIRIRNTINESSEIWAIFCFHIPNLEIPSGVITNNTLSLAPHIMAPINLADGLESSFIKILSPTLNKSK